MIRTSCCLLRSQNSCMQPLKFMSHLEIYIAFCYKMFPMELLYKFQGFMQSVGIAFNLWEFYISIMKAEYHCDDVSLEDWNLLLTSTFKSYGHNELLHCTLLYMWSCWEMCNSTKDYTSHCTVNNKPYIYSNSLLCSAMDSNKVSQGSTWNPLSNDSRH